MSSLRGLIGELWSEICNGVAWVALYRDGRSWQAEAFYPESGDYETGYVLSEDDYREIERIKEIDHKAICINGFYMGGLEDFSLKELEDKILYFYEDRLHQLQGDFIGGLVVPFEEVKGTVDGLIAGAEARSARQAYCASIFDAESKDYLIWEKDGKVLFGSKEDRLLFYDEAEAENVLDMLNENTNAPCVLLREDLEPSLEHEREHEMV